MNEDIFESLNEALAAQHSSTSFKRNELPDELLDSDFVTEDFRPPSRCPVDEHCQEFCSVTEEDQNVLIECDGEHSVEFPKSEFLYYDLSFENIVREVGDIVEREIVAYDDSSLPRYVKAETASDINIYLVVNPSEFDNTINEVCVDTLAEESPALLIASDKNIKEMLEQKALFSSSNMIYSTPFSLLAESQEVKDSLAAIEDIRGVERKFLDDLEDEEGIVNRVNSNPRYILTELNHMRLLRLAKELPRSSGTRLEKVAESAFGHLFVTQIERGGEDDRGDNVPDSVFYISGENLPEGYDSILGVADAKSGGEAGFGDEPVDGKHDEYVKEARAQSVAGDKIAHTFVVLDFDGHQDIDFYDRMDEVYNENEYLVIFTAEALAMVLSAYLSHTVSNELSLVRGSFQSVVYSMFDPDRFNSDELGLGDITRGVGRDQEDYDEKYKQRPGMMIVTPEVVKKLFKQYAESSKEIENIFENYYTPRPTV